MRYTGLLYRALNPVWAGQPLSGAGAARFGGRFNRIGRAALYATFTPDGAIREVNRVGLLQPTTLICLRADIGPLLDATDDATLARHGTDRAALADPGWRERMLRGEQVTSQDFADRLIGEGYAGAIVPGYARGAPAGARNLVLWRWEGMLEVIDDEGRLSPPDEPRQR